MAFRRSSKNKVLGGICGALGEAMDISPTGLRVVLAIVSVFTGGIPLEAAYLIAWAVLKSDADEEESAGTKEASCCVGCFIIVYVASWIIRIGAILFLLAAMAAA